MLPGSGESLNMSGLGVVLQVGDAQSGVLHNISIPTGCRSARFVLVGRVSRRRVSLRCLCQREFFWRPPLLKKHSVNRPQRMFAVSCWASRDTLLAAMLIASVTTACASCAKPCDAWRMRREEGSRGHLPRLTCQPHNTLLRPASASSCSVSTRPPTTRLSSWRTASGSHSMHCHTKRRRYVSDESTGSLRAWTYCSLSFHQPDACTHSKHAQVFSYRLRSANGVGTELRTLVQSSSMLASSAALARRYEHRLCQAARTPRIHQNSPIHPHAQAPKFIPLLQTGPNWTAAIRREPRRRSRCPPHRRPSCCKSLSRPRAQCRRETLAWRHDYLLLEDRCLNLEPYFAARKTDACVCVCVCVCCVCVLCVCVCVRPCDLRANLPKPQTQNPKPQIPNQVEAMSEALEQAKLQDESVQILGWYIEEMQAAAAQARAAATAAAALPQERVDAGNGLGFRV
jgi:hypothetical protein